MARKTRSRSQPRPAARPDRTDPVQDVQDRLIEQDIAEDVRVFASRTDGSASRDETAPQSEPAPEPWTPPMLPRQTRTALTQALFLFSASSLRHYAGFVETMGRCVPDLVQSLEGDGLTDEETAGRLRAYARELADTSIEEARRLRKQLDRVAEPSDAPAAAPGPYWRRWKAKP